MKTKQSRREYMEHKVKKRKLILPIFIVSILVLSVFGYVFSGGSQEDDTVETYGDHTFIQTPYGWRLNYEGKDYIFTYLPSALETLDFSSIPIDIFRQASKFYISSLPQNAQTPAFRDLYNTLQLSKNIQFACVEDVQGCEDYPLKTCADATSGVPVIVYVVADTNSFSYDSSCLTIQGALDYHTKVTDRFLYTYSGIIDI